MMASKKYQIRRDIDPEIFRGYDIRGLAGTQLDEDVYYTFGLAYAAWLRQRRVKECAVGRDVRLNSEAFAEALMVGLQDGGIDACDLGESLSPMVYFSAYELKTRGFAMVTASHNPKEFNGLKLGTGYSETMLTEEIAAFRGLCERADLAPAKRKGSRRKTDIYGAYETAILKLFDIKKTYRIVVDGCAGGAGAFYAKIFRAAGMEVIEQNCEPDGSFPAGAPDPTELAVLSKLGGRVKEEGADVGFAYDADGDRMSVVRENGAPLFMDAVVAIFAKSVLRRLPGAPIVFNTLCSQAVRQTILEEGGEPVIWKTGHSFIKAKVAEERAPFGGELSGHIYFADNFFPHDDAANASLRLLDFMAGEGKTIGTLASELPRYVSSPEIKLGLSDNIKFDFVDKKIGVEMRKLWPKGEVTAIDGVRIDLPDRMAIVRASQNGPYITVKFEGKTEAIYDEMKRGLTRILRSHSEIDWGAGVNVEAIGK
jgi:phosphomannomutase/phosphoglucomutase